MKYAIIKDEKVLNVIEADEANASTIAASMGAVAVQSEVAGIGQAYVNGIFADIVPVESPIVTAFRTELLAFITKLNAAYPTLSLSIDNTPAEAFSKLKASGVIWSECCTLDMLRRNLKDAQE